MVWRFWVLYQTNMFSCICRKTLRFGDCTWPYCDLNNIFDDLFSPSHLHVFIINIHNIFHFPDSCWVRRPLIKTSGMQSCHTPLSHAISPHDFSSHPQSRQPSHWRLLLRNKLFSPIRLLNPPKHTRSHIIITVRDAILSQTFAVIMTFSVSFCTLGNDTRSRHRQATRGGVEDGEVPVILSSISGITS